jgi:hypothetical protein
MVVELRLALDEAGLRLCDPEHTSLLRPEASAKCLQHRDS